MSVSRGARFGRGPWLVTYEGFVPADEGLRETLCATGNGYFVTRAAVPEARADGVHYPGTYVAGVYNRLTSHVAGESIENEDMVNVPNWLPLTFRIDDGPWFSPADVDLRAYSQELDLRRGLLTRRVSFQDACDRVTSFVQRRLVSLASPHMAALETTIQSVNWSGTLEIRSSLDGGVENRGVARYAALASRHLGEPASDVLGDDGICLTAATSQSHTIIALAARTSLRHARTAIPAQRRTWVEDRAVHDLRSVRITAGEAVTVEKIVGLYTSRDFGISEPASAARDAVLEAPPFDDLLADHVLRWREQWERAGLDAAVDERSAGILNLHLFHVLQTVSEHTADADAGVPARGLTGEAYRGHVLWDELFIFSLLDLRLPELTRAVLRYRYRRLGAARRAAARAGHRGAMFPWQSASDGREESQLTHLNPVSGRWIPDHSHLQRHVSSAIAYDFWHYHQTTGDVEFLASYGAEVILEIARFWAHLAEYDRARDRYVIRGVMGPDEFHESYPDAGRPGLDNNAYTNVMAVLVLCRAFDALEALPGQRRMELCERLRLSQTELERWEDVSRRMFVPFHEGVISQFEGYDQLAELDWDGYRARYGNMQRLDRLLEAEGDSVNRYKASKQADVLMLFFLLSADELRALFARLGYSLEPELIPRTVAYYMRRTSHGSTLSQLVHSWVLARSDRAGSWTLFKEVLQSDVADVQGGTTPEGIHLGAMAGTIDLLQRGYTGIEARGDVLWFSPTLPDDLPSLEFGIRYRGHWDIRVQVSDGRLRVSVPASSQPPVRMGYRQRVEWVAPGETFEAVLDDAR